MRTVALVSKTGCVDWFCYPNFDSPSVFGCILDAAKGGHFRIHPTGPVTTHKQLYWADTNILVTRFLSEEGVAELIDYMPVVPRGGHGYDGIIRRVKAIRGCMQFRVECLPAFNYARDEHEMQIGKGWVKFRSPKLALALASKVPFKRHQTGVAALFSLQEGESATFELRAFGPEGKADGEQLGLQEQESEDLFRTTVEYWRRWLSQSTYHGRWREMVHRSALLLKLLTFEPTGAIVAAPTCSLPESLGGARNWDYRYTWIRDAAFTVYSLMRIGFTEEAGQFVAFLDARCHEMDPEGSLQTVYGIDGRHVLTEETLDHWEGYKGSSPVRIGNGAYQQLQLDIYGELMDSLYLYNKYGTPISYDLWNYLRRLTDWVCQHWQDKDDAIWEVRGGPRDFVYSKMMSWVAVDRALRLASKRSFPADWNGWTAVRDQIYETVMKRGWNAERRSFRAAVRWRCIWTRPRCSCRWCFSSRRPIRACSEPSMPSTSHPRPAVWWRMGWCSRYDVEKTPDGLKGTEGTFNLCTFWLVEALTRASSSDPERLAKLACCSSRCSDMRIIWACTPSRSATRARRSAISRKRSLTWR